MEIGQFKIKWLDNDYLLITRYYSEDFHQTVKVAGGDVETVLSVLFISGELKNHTPFDGK